MGDVSREFAALLFALRRCDRLRGDEEQRVGALQGLRLRHLRGAGARQRGAAEWTPSA